MARDYTDNDMNDPIRNWRNDPRETPFREDANAGPYYGRPRRDPYAMAGPGWGVGGFPFSAYHPGPYGPPFYDRAMWQPSRPGDRTFFDRASDEVASWFGDDDAEERREQDHRGRGPKDYRRSDERILEDVNDYLTEDAVVDATDVQVAVTEREVTLDGIVGSRRQKRRAEDCAEDVMGVQHVQNNLRVKQSGDTFGAV
ncbi:BON domain-containing protein [Chachezhania antarctica]|uniref:BON domain-containing protein n=1 Tax=Chachezhania antarctica TaxID=2340860 RepID=UPI000EAD1C17|nr:BON domain-containing protein [Chachezhania antarctica]|tara:strand:- start:1233 stop:1829 length:597 start_codon:yes stop_codon:yes gene_type:complete